MIVYMHSFRPVSVTNFEVQNSVAESIACNNNALLHVAVAQWLDLRLVHIIVVFLGKTLFPSLFLCLRSLV